MKILLICSAKFESMEEKIASHLKNLGHEVIYTSGYDEIKPKNETWLEYGARMMQKSIYTISSIDAVLCLNNEKDNQPNYIGGATLCEIAYAFEHNKKIFILNDLPDDSIMGPKIRTELEMFKPIILHGKLENIK